MRITRETLHHMLEAYARNHYCVSETSTSEAAADKYYDNMAKIELEIWEVMSRGNG